MALSSKPTIQELNEVLFSAHCSQVVVRKMACHNGLAFGRDKPADRGAKAGGNKKRKVPGSGSKKTSKRPGAKKSKTA